MSLLNCNLKERKNKHLNERERYKIEILLKEKMKPKDIAKRLGRTTRTIERERKRGTIILLNSDLTYRKEYCADVAQRDYIDLSKNKGPGLKIGKDHKLAKHIEKKIIEDKYSPDAVIGEIKQKNKKFDTTICTKTLYNYIEQGVFANISNKDLPIKRNKKKGKYNKVRIAHNNLKGTSIEERPKNIETREEYGHWEMDCVVGKRKGGGSSLLVLTERKFREQIIIKMPNQKQKSVIKALDKLEKQYGNKFKEKFKTITVDNGVEFLDHKNIERSIRNPEEKRTKIYYCHPYSSWERGSNENANRLIRRFIPKGTDIGKFTHEMIKFIEDWINNYPRRIFDYKSSYAMMAA